MNVLLACISSFMVCKTKIHKTHVAVWPPLRCKPNSPSGVLSWSAYIYLAIEINRYYMHELLTSIFVGFTVSNKTLEALVIRFANKGAITLEAYVNALVKLSVAHRKYYHHNYYGHFSTVVAWRETRKSKNSKNEIMKIPLCNVLFKKIWTWI